MNGKGWCYLHNGRPGSVGESCICGRLFTHAPPPQTNEAPNLWPVIRWLEGGCDPREAAKELRLYAARLSQPEPFAGAPSSPSIEREVSGEGGKKETDHG